MPLEIKMGKRSGAGRVSVYFFESGQGSDAVIQQYRRNWNYRLGSVETQLFTFP
jgi:hypothetical protein